MRDSTRRLAQVLSSTDWSWVAGSWDAQVERLGLKERENVGSRRTYVGPQGDLWDAYFAGNKLSFLEINYDVFEGVDSLSDSEYEDAIDEYLKKFEDDVKEVEEVLGKPIFCDGGAARGFPDDQEANWLALWPAKNARLMLQQKHEARELPFRLCFVIAPPSEDVAR